MNVTRENFELVSMSLNPNTTDEDVAVETEDSTVEVPPEVIKQMGGVPVVMSVFEIKETSAFRAQNNVSSRITGIDLGSIRSLLQPIRFSFRRVRAVS